MKTQAHARTTRRATATAILFGALLSTTIFAPLARAQEPLPPLAPQGDVLFIAGGGIAIDASGNYVFYFDQDGDAQQDECDYLLVIAEYRQLPWLILGGRKWYAMPHTYLNTGIPSPLSGNPITIQIIPQGLGYQACTIYADFTPYYDLVTWLLSHEIGIDDSVNDVARRFQFDPFTGDINFDFDSNCAGDDRPDLVYVCSKGDASATVAAATLCGQATDAIVFRTNGAGVGCRLSAVGQTILQTYKEVLALLVEIIDSLPVKP